MRNGPLGEDSNHSGGAQLGAVLHKLVQLPALGHALVDRDRILIGRLDQGDVADRPSKDSVRREARDLDQVRRAALRYELEGVGDLQPEHARDAVCERTGKLEFVLRRQLSDKEAPQMQSSPRPVGDE